MGALLTVTVHDGGEDRDLFSLPATQTAGSTNLGQFPFILNETHIFEAMTQVTVTITNNDVDAYNGVYFSMEGRKIFEVPLGP
jgi:hypothetical protein